MKLMAFAVDTAGLANFVLAPNLASFLHGRLNLLQMQHDGIERHADVFADFGFMLDVDTTVVGPTHVVEWIIGIGVRGIFGGTYVNHSAISNGPHRLNTRSPRWCREMYTTMPGQVGSQWKGAIPEVAAGHGGFQIIAVVVRGGMRR